MKRIVPPGIALVAVTYALARLSFGLFLPDISNALDLSESQAGLIGTLGYLAYVLALLFSNLFIKKAGYLRVVQAAGLCAVIGLIGISLSFNLPFLGLSTLLAGLGSGWSSAAYSEIVKSHVIKGKRDQANSLINTGTSFGVIVSGPIALLFSGYWRNAFLFFALLALLTLIWTSLTVPKSAFINKSESFSLLSFSATVKKAQHLLSASLLIGLSSAIFWTFSRSYLTVVYNWDNFNSVIFWIIMGAAGIGGSVAGTLIKAKGLNFTYRFFVFMLIFSISLIVIPYHYTIYLSAILFGITYIAMTGTLLIWGTRCFPDTPNLGVSLGYLGLGFGQTIGSTLAGITIESVSYPVSFLLFASIGILALLIPVKT